jgi:hypothetical protein
MQSLAPLKVAKQIPPRPIVRSLRHMTRRSFGEFDVKCINDNPCSETGPRSLLSSSPHFVDSKLDVDMSDKSQLSSPPYQYDSDLVTTKEWVQNNITHDLFGRIKRYLISLFPILSWIYRYNLTWATGGIFSDA